MTWVYIRYFVIFVLLSFTLSSFGRGNLAGKQINLVFRYDDYSANSVTGAELKIIEAFRKHAVPITFGIIPFKVAGDVHDPSAQDLLPLDSVKAKILRTAFEEGILEISLHGYSHQTNSREQLSEFANLDYPEQVDRLARGKTYLQDLTGARVITFLPPWNTYDLNTLSALEETGFSMLSANKKGLVDKGSNLRFLPVSCGLTELQEAVKAARKSSDNQPLVVALLHDYDFLDINKDLGVISYREFFELIDWANAQEDIRIISLSEAGEVIGDLSADRAMRVKRINYPEKIPPLSLGSSRLLYQESPSLVLAILKSAVFYAIIIMIGTVLFSRIRKLLSGKRI